MNVAENGYLGVFEVADYESDDIFFKNEMGDSIWRKKF